MFAYSEDGQRVEGPETLAQTVDHVIRKAWLDLDFDSLHNPLDAVKAVRMLETFAEQRKEVVIYEARKNGATWQQIADALGITRQAAQKRWGFMRV
jgi:hypothetical protein